MYTGEEIIAKKSTLLLRIAKKIFGEFEVDNVFVVSHYYPLSETYEWVLEEIQRDEDDAIGDQEIDIGAKTIVIEFSGGHLVKFTSSEWGSITKVNKEDYHFIE